MCLWAVHSLYELRCRMCNVLGVPGRAQVRACCRKRSPGKWSKASGGAQARMCVLMKALCAGARRRHDREYDLNPALNERAPQA